VCIYVQRGFPKIGVPTNHPKLDYFSIETHGFGDSPILRNLHMYSKWSANEYILWFFATRVPSIKSGQETSDFAILV